ncbi:MAG: RNA pseudouridine synthase [Bacteroidales bacterium]|nr:RNA pseudouridine synthase [Bacteroidales bacterium]MCF8334395.1 RNA pseudouridine synthase [Bacteroidales bacterium]
MASKVLFEDNHLLIVNKQPSEIVQGDKTGDTPLSEKYKYFLQQKYDKPGNIFLGVVHRIDRPTSGVVIFAKTSKALGRLNRMLQEHRITKYYWAVVARGMEPAQATLEHYMVRNPQKNKSYAFPDFRKNAKIARMQYQTLGHSDRYSLLQVRLLTGRHHQVRSQLSATGNPIKGDIKYGFHTTNSDASIHLHARKVIFDHPVKNTEVNITAPVPDDKLWKHFERHFG